MAAREQEFVDEIDRLLAVLPENKVVICKECRYAVPPSQLREHLASRHSHLRKTIRRSIVAQIQADVRIAHHPQDVIYPKPQDSPLDGLPIYYNGLRCLGLDEHQTQCPYVCCTIRGMQIHCQLKHGWENAQPHGGDARKKQKHAANKLWECDRVCQRFFRTGRWMQYFEVSQRGSIHKLDDTPAQGDLYHFFQMQELGVLQSKENALQESNRVQGFDAHRSTVVPWLRTTGIAEHIHGLKKDEIHAATVLPKEEDEPMLRLIVHTLEIALREAHSWCFDGPECRLTWPCQVVLGRFQTSEVETLGRTRPFEPRKDPSSLNKYFSLAKRLVAYVHRVATSRDDHFTVEGGNESRRPENVMEMTSQQLQLWRRISHMAKRQLAEADKADSKASPTGPEDELKEQLVEMLMLLICHDTASQRYRSPVLSFLAMLSVRPSTLSWMRPGDFNSHLSAIIWVAQLVIFYDSARRDRRGEGRTLELVKDTCRRYMQQTTETPFGEILRWRLLLFHISKENVGTHQAEWDETEQVLSFQGTRLSMDQIPKLLVSEYRQCQQLLYGDLMLGSTGLERMHAWALKDRPDVETMGWDITQHPENEQMLRGSDQALLLTIQKSKHLCQTFVVKRDHAPAGFAWRDSALASYEATVQEFLNRLSVLVHISGGQPVRESEFFSMTWRNTERPRSITLRHDRMMIHLNYHKGQQQTGKYKDNIRFLAHPISDLILDYLVYVQPLRQTFLRHISPKAILSPFLWEKDRKVWPDGRLSRNLEAASALAEIPRLHISNWRQMTVAIVKTKFAGDIACFEADDDDDDAEEMDDDIRVMTKQRNHKTRTVNRAYANQTGASFGNVWDGLIRMGLRASTLWQDFWGVDTILADKKRRRDGPDDRLTKRIAAGIYRPRRPWSSAALLGALRKLYDNDELQWKSAEQERALVTVMSWTEQVVAVLPTGAGKSLLFMLPCSLPDSGVTVLIVPLVALRGDLMRRLAELRIRVFQWLPGERREASLVLVTVEAASTKDFLTYCQSLIAEQKLDRIVVDECHLTVTAAHYRGSMEDLAIIRSLRTQFVYLTATLPPSMQAEFEERNHLIHPKVIRASSNRPNVFYVVRRTRSGEGSLFQQAAREARTAYRRTDGFDMARDKIILYVQTRDDAAELAALLGCSVYTARSGSAEEKCDIIEAWLRSPTQPCLVATTAFAEGFDYPHVRLVINVNEPQSLVLFAQESGRAGRDGRPATSLVILPSSWESQTEDEFETPSRVSAIRDAGLGKQRERRAMHRYLEGQQCFRTSLSSYLDSPNDRRWCMADDVACDVCRVCHEEPLDFSGDAAEQRSSERFTGASVIQRARRIERLELARYREDLLAMRGSCGLCHVLQERWDHRFAGCLRRFDVFRERDRTRQRHKQRGRDWLQRFTACYWCLNPQIVCPRADPTYDAGNRECEDGDAVLPICYGIFLSERGTQWLYDKFGRRFHDLDGFFDWIGEESRFGGSKAIQAVRVAAAGLIDMHLF